MQIPARAAAFERCTIRQSHFQGPSPWAISVLPDDIVVQWKHSFTFAKVRIFKSSMEESCIENVEVAIESLESIEHSEFLGVLVRDISDNRFKRMSDGNLLLRNVSTMGLWEKRASILLKRCILPRKQTAHRSETARAIVASLDPSDRQLLRWVLGSTSAYWKERRIEPVPSVEVVLADCLARIGSPENKVNTPRSRFRKGS